MWYKNTAVTSGKSGGQFVNNRKQRAVMVATDGDDSNRIIIGTVREASDCTCIVVECFYDSIDIQVFDFTAGSAAVDNLACSQERGILLYVARETEKCTTFLIIRRNFEFK